MRGGSVFVRAGGGGRLGPLAGPGAHRSTLRGRHATSEHPHLASSAFLSEISQFWRFRPTRILVARISVRAHRVRITAQPKNLVHAETARSDVSDRSVGVTA